MTEAATLTPFDRLDGLLAYATARQPAHRISGKVARISPTYIVVSGLSKFVSIGDAVSIAGVGGAVLADEPFA